MLAGAGLKFRIWRPAGDSTKEKTTEKAITEKTTREKTGEKTTRGKTTREKTREITGEKTTKKTPRKKAATEKTTEKMASETATTEKTTEKTMGNTATNILRIVRDFPSISMKDLAIKCGITEDGVYWNFKQLKALGRIRRIGPDKGGHWEVVS